MAATYPDDVANAARFVRENPSLTGAALDQALQGQNWDPSVLSLAAYPRVLRMMRRFLEIGPHRRRPPGIDPRERQLVGVFLRRLIVYEARKGRFDSVRNAIDLLVEVVGASSSS